MDTNGVITTAAGRYPNGFTGDGGPATNAQLQSSGVNVSGIAVDGFGNFFISDTGNYRVRKVDTNGIITTVAGNGSAFYSGDGGPATNTAISPEGVAVDRLGNLFIAETHNQRIRKVDTNGIITTVAGTGFMDDPLGDGGAATNASLNNPMGVAVDDFGNLFIADTVNSRIRKVDTNGIITTIAGSNYLSGYAGDGGSALAARLNQPSRAIPDAFGNIFIADTFNYLVRKVDTNGIITTVAGKYYVSSLGDGGAATNASLNNPLDLALDAYGNLYIADSQHNRIRRVGLAGSPILPLNNITTNVAGNYQVIITSPSGSVTSSNAALIVLLPPSITSQPANITVTNGGSANFNVTVSGTAPLTYQWWMSSGRVATAVPVFLGGRVLRAVVTSGGAGYSSVPKVQFIGGSGTGAAGTAVVSNGMVAAIIMTSQGSGYFSSPIILIDAPSVTNAFWPDQTNATLSLSPATSANATNYFVVVTNNYGSVTSATVALTVFLPPQQFTAQYFGTGLQLQLTGTPYYPYILQTTTNLTPPISWKSILTNPADMNGNWQFTDTNLNGIQRFYRVAGQ